MNKDILQNYYNSFINQKDQRTFLSGLADYVGFILEDEGSKGIISDILKTKQTLLNEKEKWEKIVENQTRAMKREILSITGEKESSSQQLSDELADRTMYSKAYPKLLDIEKNIRDGRNMSTWGAWDKINAIYLATLNKEYELESLQQQEDSFWIPKMVKEVNGIMSSEWTSKTTLEKYKPYVMRFHNYLLRKIEGESQPAKDKTEENTHGSDLSQNNLEEVKSILIIANESSINNDRVWLVFNDDFDNGVSFSVRGKRGMDSYIKTLYDVVYGNKIGTRIDYHSATASDINSKIFKRKAIKGKYKQTTIVEKDKYKYKLNPSITIGYMQRGLLTKEQAKSLLGT
jgi:hypothetical protein